jgi:hypothetical protein
MGRPAKAGRRRSACDREQPHEDAMRPGTVIVLAILLALILGAAVIQLVFLA